jgi:hypothetical protein
MKNELELKERASLIQLENTENNSQIILFLENKLDKLPEEMKNKWDLVREMLTKIPDVYRDKGGILTKKFHRTRCYEELKPWKDLLIDLIKIETEKAELILQIEEEKSQLRDLTKLVKNQLSNKVHNIQFVKGQLSVVEQIKQILTQQTKEKEFQIILNKKVKLTIWEERLKILDRKLDRIFFSTSQKKVQELDKKNNSQTQNEVLANFFQNLLIKKPERQNSSKLVKVSREEEIKEMKAQIQAVEVKLNNIDWNKITRK